MTPVHAISLPARGTVPFPSLRRAGAPSLPSGAILALILLALLLQATFFAGLATGGLDAPRPAAAARTAALAR